MKILRNFVRNLRISLEFSVLLNSLRLISKLYHQKEVHLQYPDCRTVKSEMVICLQISVPKWPINIFVISVIQPKQLELFMKFIYNQRKWSIIILLQIEANLNLPNENLLIWFPNASLLIQAAMVMIAWCRVQYYIQISRACLILQFTSQFAIYFIVKKLFFILYGANLR